MVRAISLVFAVGEIDRRSDPPNINVDATAFSQGLPRDASNTPILVLGLVADKVGITKIVFTELVKHILRDPLVQSLTDRGKCVGIIIVAKAGDGMLRKARVAALG